MKTGIKVGDAMTRNPIAATPDESVVSCAKKMLKHDVGSLVIKEGHKVVGVVTDRDIIDRVVSKKKDPEKTKVREVMTTKLVTISQKEDMYEAFVIMGNEDIRWLPVVDKNRFAGLLTMKDILKIQPALFDLVASSMILREEKNKIKESGCCDICGSRGSLVKVGDRWLCGGCK